MQVLLTATISGGRGEFIRPLGRLKPPYPIIVIDDEATLSQEADGIRLWKGITDTVH